METILYDIIKHVRFWIEKQTLRKLWSWCRCSIFSIFCLGNLAIAHSLQTIFLLDECFYISITWDVLKLFFSRLHTRPIKSESLRVWTKHWYFLKFPSNGSRSSGNYDGETVTCVFFPFKNYIRVYETIISFLLVILWICSDSPFSEL